MTPNKTQSTPRLKGIPQEAAEEIRVLAQTIQRLTGRTAALENAGFLTETQAEKKYSPSVMAQELSAAGSAPLNVLSVGGRLIVQPQPQSRRR